ncbi:MAG: hypothetical protein R8G66_16705 [Cytophagales bacterium]|nr:hypothetical protein [Cytophagales bacterium]
MDFKAFSTDFAKEVDGTYDEYDDMKSVFIIPLANGRNQTVIAEIKEHTDGRQMIRVDSRICKLFSPIKYSEILAASANFIHTRFIAEDDYLKAEASFYLDNLNEGIIKEMIMEVAQVADDWELEITGEDIH